MMQTEELKRERWDDSLMALTKEAKDHPMIVRLESLKLGDQVLAKGLLLVQIGVEKKGSEAGAIEIIAERPDGSHLTHLIPSPERLYLARFDDRHAFCLDIEDTESTKTLVFVAEAGV